MPQAQCLIWCAETSNVPYIQFLIFFHTANQVKPFITFLKPCCRQNRGILRTWYVTVQRALLNNTQVTCSYCPWLMGIKNSLSFSLSLIHLSPSRPCCSVQGSLTKARRAASQLRPSASEFSGRTVRSQSSERRDNPPLLQTEGAMRKSVLAPLPLRGTTPSNRRLSDSSMSTCQTIQLVGTQPGNVEAGAVIGSVARGLNPLRRKYRQGGDNGRDRDRSSVCVLSWFTYLAV